MKKIKSLLVAAPLICASIAALSSCGRGGGDDPIDTSKTQIRVHNFAGGYGSKWISDVKNAFEDAVAQRSFEPGKTGVQIHITGDKSVFQGEEIKGGNYDVYFLEQAEYVDYVTHGCVEDISEAITGENEFDNNKKLLDKFTVEQKDFYGFEEDGKTKYFGIPHYSGQYGLNYDIDLFDQRGFYFKKGHIEIPDDYKSVEPKGTATWGDLDLFTDNLDERSEGPDGKAGTDDDGLPVTFNEFYVLCDYMVSGFTGDEVFPLIHNGNTLNYIPALTSNLLANLDGHEVSKVNYGFSGEIDVIDEGSHHAGAYTTTKVSVTDRTGFNVLRTPGRYNSIRFMTNMLFNKNWNYADNYNDSFSHVNAQRDFIFGGREESFKKSAFLLDGSWWQNEANDQGYWDAMVKKFDENESMMKRRFGFMPFPRAKASDPYESVYLDHLNAVQVCKAGISGGVKDAAVAFLKFVNTDEALRKFTTTTNCTRALNYTLTAEDKAAMSPYGRSVYEYKAASKILYPVSKSDVFRDHQKDFNPAYFWKVNVGTDSTPYEAYSNYILQKINDLGDYSIDSANNIADDLFTGLCNRYSQKVWEETYKNSFKA